MTCPDALQSQIVDVAREQLGPIPAFALEQGFYVRNTFIDPVGNYRHPMRNFFEEHGLHGQERILEFSRERAVSLGDK